MNKEKLTTQPFENIVTDEKLRTRLWQLVEICKSERKETQQELSKWIGISLTKIKEIEKGTCKDFNAINNYINYLGESLFSFQSP